MPSAIASHPTLSPLQLSSSRCSAAARSVGSMRSRGPRMSPSRDRAPLYVGPPSLKCATGSRVEQAAGATGSHRSGHKDEAVDMQRSRVEDKAGEKRRKQDEDKAKVTQRCTQVDEDGGMRRSSQGDEAEEKQRTSDEEEPEEMQSRGEQDEAVHKQPRADVDKECPGLDHPGQNKKERPKLNHHNQPRQRQRDQTPRTGSSATMDT